MLDHKKSSIPEICIHIAAKSVAIPLLSEPLADKLFPEFPKWP